MVEGFDASSRPNSPDEAREILTQIRDQEYENGSKHPKKLVPNSRDFVA
jgi:hypothetical protein